MNTITYQLKIEGLATPAGTITVRALVQLLQGLTDCAQHGLRLAIEGASIKSGRPPAWLEKAVDLTVSGLEKGSTVLDIEASTLGEVLGPELQQQDFWMKPPAPEDTAFSVIARSVRDTTAEILESDYYDAGVLRSLLNLRPFLKTEAKAVQLVSAGRPHECFVLTMAEMEKVERLKTCMHDPQAFIDSGHLDAIQHSRKRFQLVLPEGQVIPGRIDEQLMNAESLREFWGRDVTVKGTVHFKPSGAVQLLEAQLIKGKEPGEELFAEVPRAQTEAQIATEALQTSGRKDWLGTLWAKWPGDEPVEEILEALKR